MITGNTNTAGSGKALNFVRKHWFFALMLVSAITLLFIHTIYKIRSPFAFLETVWEPGDVLSFVGSIIGAVATIYVLQETIRFTVLSQKEEHTASIRPYFVLSAELFESQSVDIAPDEQEIKLINSSSSTELDRSLNLILHLQNVGAGNAIVQQIIISKTESDVAKCVCNTHPALLVGEKYYIRLVCKPETLHFKMTYTDIEELATYCAETKLHLTRNAGRNYLSIDPLVINQESK